MGSVWATKNWLIYQATLLLMINWRVSTADKGFLVDPPDDLWIQDPGFLGYLKISWSSPASLINATECPKQYQLEYFNAYSSRWNAIRTPMNSYSAQFDLMKDVRVRVYTLLSGPCTGGEMIKSTNYTELVLKPPNTGAANTKVQDLECVNYDMINLECTWKRGAKTPDNAQQNLYFWHKPLEYVKECPNYIISSGIRSGCRFPKSSLPVFTDINFCVNGSSSEGPLQPQFISLQIQNHVKPPTAEKVCVHAGPDPLEIRWEYPVGSVPEHCLEWEVEHRLEGPDGRKTLELTSTTERSLKLPSADQKKKNCFRIRSKLHTYCAEKGFWSDWSQPTCLLEKKDVMPGAEQIMTPNNVYVAAAIIATLVLFLCVGSAAFKMRKSVCNHAAEFS
uniref:Class I helical cytokine receptor number 18 n=1 Tax=Tetraodon nigroviridis TaxID=99883 RepID=Q6UAN8_TETNG|nr:class I helical cytokine receptor number 18 [Tetraodon nigroviridis]